MEDEIAELARRLQGAIDVARLGGIETLPRPHFAAAAAPAASASRALTVAAAAPAARAKPAPAVAARTGTSADEVIVAPPRPSPLPIVGDATVDAIQAILASSAGAAEQLERLRTEVIGECKRCKLHRGRSKLVFGVGNANAKLVFVGEGPGADEDRQGIPFVGKAGQLLTKMIEAMGWQRDDVYICNVVKCRPPNNRDPEPDEVEACEKFLKAQLAIVKPEVIVCLGRHAAQTLLRTKTPISKLRGTWQSYEGIDLMPTYHPSYLLREEADPDKKRKREAWSDLQQVMKIFAAGER